MTESNPASFISGFSSAKEAVGKFVVLRFPDCPMGMSSKPSMKLVVETVSRALKIKVGHMEGMINLCEFVWPQKNAEYVLPFLIGLRARFPDMVVSIRERSTFPPHGC